MILLDIQLLTLQGFLSYNYTWLNANYQNFYTYCDIRR